MTEAEAQEMITRLEEYYGERVWPLSRVCAAFFTWMECVAEINQGESPKHGYQYAKGLPQMRIDIMKSNLLGRLLIAKEKFRTKKCPIHDGHFNGDAMFFNKCPHKCDGTGWLRESEKDGGYTGFVDIRLATREDLADLLSEPDDEDTK